MANYKYISIPSNRLSQEWLDANGFSDMYEVFTFISYHTSSEDYDHYNHVEDADNEFICNTQEEFIQKVNENKLMDLL